MPASDQSDTRESRSYDWGDSPAGSTTTNFAATASADGEVRVWDLRAAAEAAVMTLAAAGAAGDG
jgi:WD40 repeat protein